MTLLKMWLIYRFFSSYWENTLVRERHERHGTLVYSFSATWKCTRVFNLLVELSLSVPSPWEIQQNIKSSLTLPKHNLQNTHFISCYLSMAEFVQHMYVPGNTAEKLRSTSLWMQWHIYIEVLKQFGLFWNGSLQICWVSMKRPSRYSLRAASFQIGKPGHNQIHSSTEKVKIQQTLEHKITLCSCVLLFILWVCYHKQNCLCSSGCKMWVFKNYYFLRVYSCD